MTMTLQENIITKLGLDNLPADEKVVLLGRMAEIIQKRIAIRIIKLIPESALDEYLKMAEKDEKGAHEFLSKIIPSYPAIAEEEIVNFKNEMADEKK